MTLPGGDPGLGPGIWSRRTFLHKKSCDTPFQTAIGLLSPNIWVPEVLDPTKVLQGPPRGFLGTWDLEVGDPFPKKMQVTHHFPLPPKPKHLGPRGVGPHQGPPGPSQGCVLYHSRLQITGFQLKKHWKITYLFLGVEISKFDKDLTTWEPTLFEEITI